MNLHKSLANWSKTQKSKTIQIPHNSSDNGDIATNTEKNKEIINDYFVLSLFCEKTWIHGWNRVL